MNPLTGDAPHFPTLTWETRPVGPVGVLNRLAELFVPGLDPDTTLDLMGQHVAVHGHRVVTVSAQIARDLLGRPWTNLAQRAATLNTLLTWAKDQGGYYEVPIVRRRWTGRTTIAPLRIEQRHTTGGSEEWVAFWWHES